MAIYFDDAPRQDPLRDDELGYSVFAENTANFIRNLNAPNGYVLSINGPWGSGKSTALNFVSHFLEKYSINDEPAPPVRVLRFEPWIFSGHLDLISSFFKFLAQELSIENRIDRFKRWIALQSRPVSSSVSDAASTIGAIFDPTGGLLARGGGQVAAQSIERASDRILKDPSLQDSYKKLFDLLAECDEKIVIFIDDIDRLNDTEVRSVVQLVKSVGQLPNVI